MPARASMRAVVGAALAVSALGAAASSPCAGPVEITLAGQSAKWNIAVSGGDASRVATNGGSMTMQYGARAYLTDTCSGSAIAPGFFANKLKLLGKTLSYTVDLAADPSHPVGCACNAAFYMTEMPAIGSDQKPVGGGAGDFYCDANDVGGEWCVEMDIMEANTAAMSVTPHKCDAPTGHHYTKCDKGGCSVNTYKESPKNFGPGSNHTINSLQPFSVSTSFGAGTAADKPALTNVTTVLSQAGRSFVLHHTDAKCGAKYLESMTDAFQDGMVVIFGAYKQQPSHSV